MDAGPPTCVGAAVKENLAPAAENRKCEKRKRLWHRRSSQDWSNQGTDQRAQGCGSEQQEIEQEKQRAEQAELQLRQVAINLLQNGMSVEQVAQLTNLDILEVEQLIN